MTHEVQVLCNCDNVEQCRLETYVSDVRIAYGVIKMLEAALRQGQGVSRRQMGLNHAPGGALPNEPTAMIRITSLLDVDCA